MGLGLEYRSSNGRTFAAMVFTESPDHTGAGAVVTASRESGNDLSWSWRGWDVRLQTHTAGFRDFDVQLRVDGGSWYDRARQHHGHVADGEPSGRAHVRPARPGTRPCRQLRGVESEVRIRND